MKEVYISFVTAVRNEEGNLEQLHKEITKAAEKIAKPWEVIYVENGSTDGSINVLRKLPHSKTLSLRWHPKIGKTAQSAALDAGVKEAKGKYIATLDSDLEDDPAYIPQMLKKLKDEEVDVVAGWRVGRKDPLSKRIITKVAKGLRKALLGESMKDSGCTLRVYKKECFEDIDLHGEMHRYIGALLKWRGFSIAEMPVKNRERTYGVTKYKADKAIRGFVDLISIWFWKKYSDRPIHLFGPASVLLTLGGLFVLFVLALLRIFVGYPLSTSIWPIISVLAIISGVQLFVTGLLADQIIKNYYSNGKRRSYLIKEVIENE